MSNKDDSFNFWAWWIGGSIIICLVMVAYGHTQRQGGYAEGVEDGIRIEQQGEVQE